MRSPKATARKELRPPSAYRDLVANDRRSRTGAGHKGQWKRIFPCLATGQALIVGICANRNADKAFAGNTEHAQ